MRDVPSNAKIITSNWTMKKKTNGIYRSIINARRFEQLEGMNYNEANIASPVTNDTIISMAMVLALMASWEEIIIYVKGDLFHGGFEEEDETCYMEVLHVFEKYYDNDVFLMLFRTLYRIKNTENIFGKIC